MGLFGRQDDERRERTAAERERARAEREARRAARNGTAPPPPPPEEPVWAPEWADEPVAAEPSPAPAEASPTPAEPSPASAERAPGPAEPSPAPAPPKEPPAAPAEPAPAEPAAAPVATARRRIPPLPNEVARFGDGGDEPPAGTRRLGRRRPPAGPPPNGNTPHRRRRRVTLALLVAAAAGIAYLLVALFQPFAGDAGDSVVVRIPPSSTAADIGDLLERQGVVDSSLFFTIRARLSGQRDELKAGTYRLRRDMSYSSALDALTEGPGAPATIDLTIPEGRSRREAAPLVERAGVRGDYLQASRRQRGFDPRDYGAPRRSTGLEGFLFPATYELRPTATAVDLVARQVAAFERAIDKVPMRRARARNLNVYDVLIIASMVEREAQLAKERPLIAAVIHNRLREGMPLGIDATIRYATRNWSRPLRRSELNVDSPYNTRRHTGLPPTPIGNPGLDSIRAAADPANQKYLYYVVKPGTCGEHAFSSTDAQFQRDVERYNRERARRGGQSPTNC